MAEQHALTDDQCDRLVALTMDKIAAKHNMHALELNADLREHHALRRAIVRAAYMLGQLAAATLEPKP
jgi:hypothetical protein